MSDQVNQSKPISVWTITTLQFKAKKFWSVLWLQMILGITIILLLNLMLGALQNRPDVAESSVIFMLFMVIFAPTLIPFAVLEERMVRRAQINAGVARTYKGATQIDSRGPGWNVSFTKELGAHYSAHVQWESLIDAWSWTIYGEQSERVGWSLDLDRSYPTPGEAERSAEVWYKDNIDKS